MIVFLNLSMKQVTAPIFLRLAARLCFPSDDECSVVLPRSMGNQQLLASVHSMVGPWRYPLVPCGQCLNRFTMCSVRILCRPFSSQSSCV